jgi:formylglycine-generating enzyme required for sulfatase activity
MLAVGPQVDAGTAKTCSGYSQDGDGRSYSIRGGSVWSSPGKLRAAHRAFFSFRHTDARMGFRIARTLPPPPAERPQERKNE